MLADLTKASAVRQITQETIAAVYPHYYPAGAVAFFQALHSAERIAGDIAAEKVYLLKARGTYVGTVTINANEINRLFVLPRYQKLGYGRCLLDFAEEKISLEFDRVVLAASLPAKRMYQIRGYTQTEYHVIETENGDMLCYDMMSKSMNGMFIHAAALQGK